VDDDGAMRRASDSVLHLVISGAELSATQIRQRNLANADHLAVLHAIWTAETRCHTRPGTRRSARPPQLGTPGRPHRRIPRDVRL